MTFSQTIALSLEGMNHTSAVPIRPTTRADLRISELTENGAWVEMPAKSCSVGHTISLKIHAKIFANGVPVETTEKNEPLNFTAMVDDVEGDATGASQLVLVSFRQHKPAEWNELLAYFSQTQARMNALLARTRK